MKLFQKRKEDFVCEKCGAEVKGDGYTNHCPECLWGKHVDVNPGDRVATCRGLMEPVGVEARGDTYTLIHKCERCGFERKNKVSPHDNFDEVIKISKKHG
jgi:hypothetical protein